MNQYEKLCKDILDLMITAYWQGCEDGKEEDPALEDGFRTDAELMIVNVLKNSSIRKLTLENKTDLWDVINRYVDACGGRTGRNNIAIRANIVVEVEKVVEGIVNQDINS